MSKAASQADGLPRQPTFWTKKRLALALGLLFVAGIVAAALDLRFGFGGTPRRVEPDSLLVLDPRTGATRKVIVLGSAPSAVSLRADGVAVEVAGEVRRVDLHRLALSPVRGAQVTLSFQCPKGGTLLLRQGENSWYACERAPVLVRLSSTGVRTPVAGLDSAPVAGAYGAGRVWAVEQDQNELVAVNPFTAKVVSRTVVGTDPVAVTVGFGAVWVANAGNGSVTRIGLSDGKVEAIGLDYQPDRLAAGAGAIWVVSRTGRTVIRIDPRGREVTKTIRLANPPVDVAAGAGRVWVAIGH